MMAKVKASVYPNAIVRNGYIFLGVHGPLSWRGDHVFWSGAHCCRATSYGGNINQEAIARV